MAAGSSSLTTFDKPSDREILITHVFDAPRELVWKVMTDPATIPQWWGPRSQKTTVDKMDVREGGSWRFISHGEDGVEHAFHGEYREVVPPERLVYTFEYEGMPGHVSLEQVRYEEHDGKTSMTNTVLFDSMEDRDGMFEAGMESGSRETMERLDELLRTMA